MRGLTLVGSTPTAATVTAFMEWAGHEKTERREKITGVDL